jgi:hypothetical protein
LGPRSGSGPDIELHARERQARDGSSGHAATGAIGTYGRLFIQAAKVILIRPHNWQRFSFGKGRFGSLLCRLLKQNLMVEPKLSSEIF